MAPYQIDQLIHPPIDARPPVTILRQLVTPLFPWSLKFNI